MKTLVSFLALFLSPCLSTAFFQSMSICKPDYRYLLKQIKIFGHNLFKMQSCFDREFCCSSCRSEPETVAGVVFGSFKWWQIREGK
jgi:hypothetical protein